MERRANRVIRSEVLISLSREAEIRWHPRQDPEPAAIPVVALGDQVEDNTTLFVTLYDEAVNQQHYT